MKFIIKDQLEKIENENVQKFLSSLNSYCIEQHPEWNGINDRYSQKFFIVKDEKDNIVCFANIIISTYWFLKNANINFGPAFSDNTALLEAIDFLYSYFSKNNYAFFSIQLGKEISNDTELIEYLINKKHRVHYHFKQGNVWSSIKVDLTQEKDELLKSFSKGHKSAIKSAYKKNRLRATRQDSSDFLENFISLYLKMLTFRKLNFEEKKIRATIIRINDFLKTKKIGFIQYVLDGDDLIGGVIIIFQGKTARYFKGASDPERKDFPILHFGLFEAMLYCKEEKIENFDLWGYNHFAKKSDQTFYINRFKKGFSNNFIFYPKRMNFILNRFNYSISNYLIDLKNHLKELRLID